MSERRNEVPFAGLSPTGKKGKYFELKRLAQEPDVVVKEARTKWGFFDTEGVHPLNDLERIKADLAIVKDNFAEFIPETNLVVGKNEKGKKVVYIVQHKIHGQELKKIKGNEKVKAELRSFLDRVIQTYIKNLFYLKDSKEPQSVFPDVKGWNFIVGRNKKVGEQEDRLYFVDTYPVEGASVQDFVERYISQIVKPTFPSEYWSLIDEFRLKAAKQIREYLKEHNAEIPTMK